MISPYAYNALSKYKEKPVEMLPGGELHGAEVFLLQNDYIEVDEILPDSFGGFTALSYKITEEGRNALELYEQQRSDITTARKQIKYQNIILTATLILSGISVILSILSFCL